MFNLQPQHQNIRGRTLPWREQLPARGSLPLLAFPGLPWDSLFLLWPQLSSRGLGWLEAPWAAGRDGLAQQLRAPHQQQLQELTVPVCSSSLLLRPKAGGSRGVRLLQREF